MAVNLNFKQDNRRLQTSPPVPHSEANWYRHLANSSKQRRAWFRPISPVVWKHRHT